MDDKHNLINPSPKRLKPSDATVILDSKSDLPTSNIHRSIEKMEFYQNNLFKYKEKRCVGKFYALKFARSVNPEMFVDFSTNFYFMTSNSIWAEKSDEENEEKK